MLTKMDEKRHLKGMREGLFKAFPNPERKGCPGPEIIRAIVAGKLAPDEEDKWIDHFVLCSPCSKEFFETRRSHLRKRRIRTGTIASLIVLGVALCVWGWVNHQEMKDRNGRVAVSGALSFRQQVVDLRNWSGERTAGGSKSSHTMAAELHRWRTSLVVYLPLGSEPGKYEMEILRKNSKPELTMTGVARIENENTVLRIQVDLSKLAPGQYSLGVRQPPYDWRYLPLTIK